MKFHRFNSRNALNIFLATSVGLAFASGCKTTDGLKPSGSFMKNEPMAANGEAAAAPLALSLSVHQGNLDYSRCRTDGSCETLASKPLADFENAVGLEYAKTSGKPVTEELKAFVKRVLKLLERESSKARPYSESELADLKRASDHSKIALSILGIEEEMKRPAKAAPNENGSASLSLFGQAFLAENFVINTPFGLQSSPIWLLNGTVQARTIRVTLDPGCANSWQIQNVKVATPQFNVLGTLRNSGPSTYESNVTGRVLNISSIQVDLAAGFGAVVPVLCTLRAEVLDAGNGGDGGGGGGGFGVHDLDGQRFFYVRQGPGQQIDQHTFIVFDNGTMRSYPNFGVPITPRRYEHVGNQVFVHSPNGDDAYQISPDGRTITMFGGPSPANWRRID